MMSMRPLLAAALLAFAASAIAQAPPQPPKPEPAIGLTPEAMTWTDAPPTLPPGSRIAVLEGNPRAEGMFTMRVRIPAGSAIPPHWHPRQERVTILSGAVDLGFGNVATPGPTARFRAGSFYVNPPRLMHYLFFPEATEMQMTGIGPWELFTTDISTQSSTRATATVTVRSITPAPGSQLDGSMPLKVTVDYDIKNFRPSTFFLTIQFETTTPNRTMAAPVVALNETAMPPLPKFLTTATGTTTITQDLSRVLANPELKHPIRIRVFMQELVTDRTSRVPGVSDWIEFR